jgi:hypothetical protein
MMLLAIHITLIKEVNLLMFLTNSVVDYVSCWTSSASGIQRTSASSNEDSESVTYSIILSTLSNSSIILAANSESSTSTWLELQNNISIQLSSSSKLLGQYTAVVNSDSGFNLLIGLIAWKDMFDCWTFSPQNRPSDFELV